MSGRKYRSIPDSEYYRLTRESAELSKERNRNADQQRIIAAKDKQLTSYRTQVDALSNTLDSVNRQISRLSKTAI